MENLPTFEQPSKEELTAEIERHLEIFRAYQEELQIARELNKSNLQAIEEKLRAEEAEILRKQKLLETLN